MLASSCLAQIKLFTLWRTMLLAAGSQNTVFRMTSGDAWATTRPSGSFATAAVDATTSTRGNTTEVCVP